MAQLAFRNALGRIGINGPTRTAIQGNGYATIGDLAVTEESTLNHLPKYLRSWHDPNALPAQQVRLGLVALEKIKAMRYWVLAQRREGFEEDADDFDDDVAVATLEIMRQAKDQKEATESVTIDKPTALTELKGWIKFWLKFSSYLSRIRGAAHIPLTYLVRESGEVTDDIAAAEYATEDDRLIATTVLEGPHYLLDNTTLYDEFKPLVVDGPGWSFIKKFDKAKDGRKAVLALKKQAEGLSATQTRKAAAYASLTASVYRGARRGYTYDNYVSVHQEAHNELLDLEEPVPETKKVTDFLKGIQDPVLAVGKTVVLGDPIKMSDFQECQQYLGTIVQNTGNQAKLERNVSAARTGNGGGGGGLEGSALVDKMKGGSYSDAQWGGLSQGQKERVLKYREEAKAKKKGKAKARAKKRKLAKAASARQEADAGSGEDEEEEKPNSSAGAQFGSHGSGKGKKKKSS